MIQTLETLTESQLQSYEKADITRQYCIGLFFFESVLRALIQLRLCAFIVCLRPSQLIARYTLCVAFLCVKTHNQSYRNIGRQFCWLMLYDFIPYTNTNTQPTKQFYYAHTSAEKYGFLAFCPISLISISKYSAQSQLPSSHHTHVIQIHHNEKECKMQQS